MCNGAISTIYLHDLALDTHWAFQNPAESTGLRFGVATAHVTGQDMADSLMTVTGKPVNHQAVPKEAWLQAAFGGLPMGVDMKIGFKYAPEEAIVQTYGKDVGNWFNIYRGTYHNNTGVLMRDYAFLDRILPRMSQVARGVDDGDRAYERGEVASKRLVRAVNGEPASLL